MAVVVCLVKELGADVDKTKDDGCTALYVAAQEGRVAVVVCLVKEFGADVNLAMHDGSTPLFIAAQKGHMPVLQFLAKDLGASSRRPVQTSIKFRTPEPHPWRSLLSMAAQRGRAAVVLCLVKELGADVNQARNDGLHTSVHSRSGGAHKYRAVPRQRMRGRH
jgi:hypothetical protein